MTVYQEYFGISLNRSDDGGSQLHGNRPTRRHRRPVLHPLRDGPQQLEAAALRHRHALRDDQCDGVPSGLGGHRHPGHDGFNTGGAAITAIAIAQSSPSTVYVATSGSQIFLTTNDGGSWTNVSIAGGHQRL